MKRVYDHFLQGMKSDTKRFKIEKNIETGYSAIGRGYTNLIKSTANSIFGHFNTNYFEGKTKNSLPNRYGKLNEEMMDYVYGCAKEIKNFLEKEYREELGIIELS